MSIYAKLANVLSARAGSSWKVAFPELERLIEAKLPSSAFKYPAWWSNNPSNNAMTKIWLRAGFRTEQVDIPGQSVVFRRVAVAQAASRAGFGDRPREFEYASTRAPETKMARAPAGADAADDKEDDEVEKLVSPDEFQASLPKGHPLADLFGFLKGTMTVVADLDPCAPACSPDEWNEAEAEMEAEWDELYGPNSARAKSAPIGKPTP